VAADRTWASPDAAAAASGEQRDARDQRLEGTMLHAEVLAPADARAIDLASISWMLDLDARVGGVLRRARAGGVEAGVACYCAPGSAGANAGRALAAATGLLASLRAPSPFKGTGPTAASDVYIALVTGEVTAAGRPAPGAGDERWDVLDARAAAVAVHATRLGAPLVACERTLELTAPAPPARRIDVVLFEDAPAPIALYEVLVVPPAGGDERWLSRYALGLRHYESGAFEAAATAFAEALDARPSDRAAAVLGERCRSLAASPPTAWRGAWRLDNRRG
jgi:hypothetical protein